MSTLASRKLILLLSACAEDTGVLKKIVIDSFKQTDVYTFFNNSPTEEGFFAYENKSVQELYHRIDELIELKKYHDEARSLLEKIITTKQVDAITRLSKPAFFDHQSMQNFLIQLKQIEKEARPSNNLTNLSFDDQFLYSFFERDIIYDLNSFYLEKENINRSNRAQTIEKAINNQKKPISSRWAITNNMSSGLKFSIDLSP